MAAVRALARRRAEVVVTSRRRHRLAGALMVYLAACNGPVADGDEAVLARHVHTDLYDAYPGIPSPDGRHAVFADYAADMGDAEITIVALGAEGSTHAPEIS